jgi:hypothetical protein
LKTTPSHDACPSPRFRRLIFSGSRRAALLAALALPIACDDDVIIAHDPVAQADGGAPPPSTGDAGSEPGLQRLGIARLPDVASGGSPESDIVALGVLERLEELCGGCHSNGNNGAGFSGGLDLASLIEGGLIVPGSSATSPLLGRILDGSMPPPRLPGYGVPSLTVGDIRLIADFIDQLSTGALPGCEPLPMVSLDAVYAALLADVSSRPAERRYLRYVSLTGASNARLCGPALDQQRHALFELVNGMSMQADIHLPVAIDTSALLYRIDLRDYGWNVEIDLDGDGTVDFDDGWEAALGAVPYAVVFDGPEATALASETGSAVPLSSLNALVRVASDGARYRALLGVPANLYDMELALGVDTITSLETNDVQRAGFVREPPRSDVMVTRFPLSDLNDRAYWMLGLEEPGASSIFDDPLSYASGDWTKAIWELPNGLWAYFLNDPGGAPLADVPRGCDGPCVRREWLAPVACMACHARGLSPLKDLIRPFMEESEALFDRETFADTLAVFPPADELDRILAADNERHRAARQRAGVPPDAPDPVSRVYLDFDRPLDLERAAAELGVLAQTLSDHLGVLPALAPLATPSGTVERAVFSEAHLDALCAVHATSRNRPASCP